METKTFGNSVKTEIKFTGNKKEKKETTVEQKWYLHLTAVIRYNKAKQGDGRQTDDRLDGERVDGAL